MGRQRPNHRFKGAKPPRLDGRSEKSEPFKVARILGRVELLGSEGRALGSTRTQTARDREMAGRRPKGFSIR